MGSSSVWDSRSGRRQEAEAGGIETATNHHYRLLNSVYGLLAPASCVPTSYHDLPRR